MTLGRHSGFRHVPGETGTTLQKGCFYVVVSQGNSGNKVKNGKKWCSMFLVNKGAIS